MRIVVLPPRGVAFPQDSPWMALIDGLRDGGHEVEGYGDPTLSPDAIVALNHQPVVERLQSVHGIPAARTALILLEPRVAAPAMYQPRALSFYGHRFAASPSWSVDVGGESFLWPQDLHQPRVLGQTGDFAATLINGDKRSAVPGSLYGLRRSVIEAFNEGPAPLAVFGPGWGDSPVQRIRPVAKAIAKAAGAWIAPDLREAFGRLTLHPHHWLGIADAKVQAFSAAPISIVIENSTDYVSEKLVDAVGAGVAPLYVGPRIAEYGIPSEIAIQCDANAKDVLMACLHLSAERRNEIIAAGSEWLASPDARRHDIRIVLTDLGQRVASSLRQ